MEAALTGRKLVWIKRGLCALVGFGAAAAAPYIGAVPQVGVGMSSLLYVTSAIAVNLATSEARSRVPGEFAYLHDLAKTFPDVAPVG